MEGPDSLGVLVEQRFGDVWFEVACLPLLECGVHGVGGQSVPNRTGCWSTSSMKRCMTSQPVPCAKTYLGARPPN